MSNAEESPASPSPSPSPSPLPSPSPSTFSESVESIQRTQSSIQSLSQILGPLPDHLSSSENPALSLLHDSSIAASISHYLCQSSSGAGYDNLCRWFYDTFQSTDPSLQLVVLRFLPTIAKLYLLRCTARRHYQPLAGFEAVLLALYAHETIARDGKPLSVDVPNLSAPSPYHEAKATSLKSNKNVEEPVLTTAMISAPLEPHGTVRSTKRARIVAVALELYHSKISHMPIESKLEVCRVAWAWAGRYESSDRDDDTKEKEKGEAPREEERKEKMDRIPLPWELLLPVLRILGHCLLGQSGGEELKVEALAAVKGLHERAMHDMNARAILATRSLVRLGLMEDDTVEPKISSVYTEASASDDSTKAVA